MSQSVRQPKLRLTDQVCPEIFHALEIHLDRVDVGETVVLVTGAGEQTATVARSVQGDGHTIVGIERSNGTAEITVRKERSDVTASRPECCPGGDCR